MAAICFFQPEKIMYVHCKCLRQMTDKLKFKSVISSQMNQKIGYSEMCYQQAKYIDIYFEGYVFFKECCQ